MAYTLDLRQYVNESLSRYVIIGISCDVSDSVRACKLEVKSGTAETSPSVPVFENTDTKTYLTLASIRLNGGITSISQSNIKDYRSDENKCGYVKVYSWEMQWFQKYCQHLTATIKQLQS